jgi:hypothetical protein
VEFIILRKVAVLIAPQVQDDFADIPHLRHALSFKRRFNLVMTMFRRCQIEASVIDKSKEARYSGELPECKV